MEILIEKIKVPENTNIIFGMSHFIKTVEDLYEILITCSPSAKFGIAFNEASGPTLVRYDGNDEKLIELARENQKRIAAGHSFLIVMENIYPINVLPAIKACSEVVNIFCATANPVKVILAKDGQGRGVIGIIDGDSPKGIESSLEKEKRKKFLRTIGYKR